MWWIAAAWADPPRAPVDAPELLRLEQGLRIAKFAQITERPGELPVARGRGGVVAWVWPDGTLARYQLHGRGTSEDHWLGADGVAWVTVRSADDAPVEATGAGATVPLTGWEEVQVGPARVRGPGRPATVDGASVWASAAGALSAAWLEGAVAIASDGFAEGLAEGCACRLSERGTAVADGVVGVRWLASAPHPTAPSIGEVWAFPQDGGVLVLSFATAAGAEPLHPELLTGRAAVALLRWGTP